MADFVVVRGQIEKGREVLARKGDRYKPANQKERDRLLAAGVIAEVKGNVVRTATSGNTTPERDEKKDAGDTGTGTGTGGSTETN